MADIRNLKGVVISGWTLTREIGSGADGIVYAGTKDDKEVAIKLFFPESLAENGEAAALERLELQLGLVGTQPHPNLVQVYAGGRDESLGLLYLVMDLVPGQSLDKVIGVLPPEKIPNLVKQLASAAKYLEDQELYHRDIKPANIVVSDDFEKLTLLDLGIVYQIPRDIDDARLSGMEFVATLRYSPPEFVWRTEPSNDDGAWRAVTFYQIGATLHDMIMKKVLYTGHDQPRARLYDCVKEHTPVIQSTECEKWLVQLAQACLLKDWRQRLQFVKWENFDGPGVATDTAQQERGLRLRQIRNEEVRLATARKPVDASGPTRAQELWQLNSSLFLEVRTYLLDSSIFPKFSANETKTPDGEYISQFTFHNDGSQDFGGRLTIQIQLKVAPMIEVATELTFDAMLNDTPISKAIWTEMFTVESAFGICRQALLDAVDLLLPKD